MTRECKVCYDEFETDLEDANICEDCEEEMEDFEEDDDF